MNDNDSNSRKRPLNSCEKNLPTDKKTCQSSSPIPFVSLDLDTSDCQSDTETMGETLAAQVLEKLGKLDEIQKDVKGIRENLDEIKMSVAVTQHQLSEACEEIENLKYKQNDIERLKSEVVFLKSRTEYLEKKLEDQNEYSRRENLIIKGAAETNGENCLDTVNKIFTNLGVGPFQLQRYHRLGKFVKGAAQPRNIIVRFVCFQDKLSVLKKRTMLKGSNIYLQDDISAVVEARQAELRPIVRHIRLLTPDAKVGLIKDKLQYEGKLYSKENLKDITIDLTSVGSSSTDMHTFFSGEYSPLSNLYSCKLKINETEYNSTEQYFQYQKCIAHEKPEIAMKVMSASTSREAMGIGKQVRYSDEWAKTTGIEILEKAIAEKIQCVPEFAKTLRECKDKLFAEATRHPIWGIGIQFSDNRKSNKNNWNGQNLMGQLLDKMAAEST